MTKQPSVQSANNFVFNNDNLLIIIFIIGNAKAT